MTVDREQTRRPPLEADATQIGRDWVEYANHLEQDYRVLKAELEQAKRERDAARLERDNWRTARDSHVTRLEQAEAQLAKVPALVEALRRIKGNAESWHGPEPIETKSGTYSGHHKALKVIAEWCDEALAAFPPEFEQEQKP